MEHTEQILNRLIIEKEKKETLSLNIESFCETEGQRIIVRSHIGDQIWYYHTHKFYEINYILKGNCINLIEEEPVFMKEGEFILMNPETYHLAYCFAEDEVLNFLIDKDWFTDHLHIVLNENPKIEEFVKNTNNENFYRYIFVSPKNNSFKNLVAHILEINKIPGNKKHLLLESAMLNFFNLAVFENSEIKLSARSGHNSEIGRKIIKYMNDNYKSVTLDDVASYAGYSKNHICRIFKESIGKSFSTVLSDIRLGRAKYNLINTEDTIKNIASLVGYESVEYFQRLFKRTIGVTPGEYRRKYK